MGSARQENLAMLYIHTDKHYWSDKWCRRFVQQAAKAGIPYRKVNLLRRDYRDLPMGTSDGLIGRFGHHPRDLQRMRPIYAQLDEYCGGRLFPRFHTYSFYDDKRRQMELLQSKNYPMPRTAFVESRDDVDRFLGETGLGFPLVVKKTYGASATQVRLARSLEEVLLPGILQEFCPNNDGDLRVVVIGNRVMGFRRNNRPGDFRASGSGLKDYLDDLDFECVRLAHRISAENDFESMSYDFVRDSRGRWVVLEFSYCFGPGARKCSFYYDLPSGEKKDKAGVYPEDFILADFLERHPGLRSRGGTAEPQKPSLLARCKNAIFSWEGD
jgi:hypothetical protein